MTWLFHICLWLETNKNHCVIFGSSRVYSMQCYYESKYSNFSIDLPWLINPEMILAYGIRNQKGINIATAKHTHFFSLFKKRGKFTAKSAFGWKSAIPQLSLIVCYNENQEKEHLKWKHMMSLSNLKSCCKLVTKTRPWLIAYVLIVHNTNPNIMLGYRKYWNPVLCVQFWKGSHLVL